MGCTQAGDLGSLKFKVYNFQKVNKNGITKFINVELGEDLRRKKFLPSHMELSMVQTTTELYEVLSILEKPYK